MVDQSARPPERPKARLPRGFSDSTGKVLAIHDQLIGKLSEVYSCYGFERLTTPCIEFADALGKFLPDQDRPHEGVFSFVDDDGQWLVLRYDLTAPLARYVAENFESLAFPYRRFQTGSVFRDEKPGPGRFREFIQFDADTVGTASLAADAEFCMLVSDSLEALGLPRGDYVVKVNNRKVLNGVLELIGVPPGAEGDATRLTVLRAMDKLDRLGVGGVAQLLGGGRKDESGDFTKGAGLAAKDIDRVLGFLQAGGSDRVAVCRSLADLVKGSADGEQGAAELLEIDTTLNAAGFGPERVRIDPAIVRGLAYYTGPVFEAELTFEIKDDDGRPVRFGSVGGGDRGVDRRFAFGRRARDARTAVAKSPCRAGRCPCARPRSAGALPGHGQRDACRRHSRRTLSRTKWDEGATQIRGQARCTNRRHRRRRRAGQRRRDVERHGARRGALWRDQKPRGMGQGGSIPGFGEARRFDESRSRNSCAAPRVTR